MKTRGNILDVSDIVLIRKVGSNNKFGNIYKAREISMFTKGE